MMVVAMVGVLAGCAHATPVTAAPVSPEDGAKLQAALIGTCNVTATQAEGGKKKEASDLSFTFGPDGQASYKALGITAKFKYRIDGRNVLMDGPYKALRVDDWSGPTQVWFLYDLTETYYCTKAP